MAKPDKGSSRPEPDDDAEAAAGRILEFAGLDGELPDNAPDWDAMTRRVDVLRGRLNRLHVRLMTTRPTHFPRPFRLPER